MSKASQSNPNSKQGLVLAAIETLTAVLISFHGVLSPDKVQAFDGGLGSAVDQISCHRHMSVIDEGYRSPDEPALPNAGQAVSKTMISCGLCCGGVFVAGSMG
jgi:hypothetical protein